MFKRLEGLIEWSVFASRWMLAPVFIGLIVAQGVFALGFFRELWHLLSHFSGWSEYQIVSAVLGLVDMVMVANLVLMVLIGGYATFVSKLDLDRHEDRPQWLDHIDPGTLKTKLAGALVSISGIHLLQTFNKLAFTTDPVDHGRVAWQVGIHIAFIVTTILLAWSDLVFERKLKLAHEGHEPPRAPTA